MYTDMQEVGSLGSDPWLCVVRAVGGTPLSRSGLCYYKSLSLSPIFIGVATSGKTLNHCESGFTHL